MDDTLVVDREGFEKLVAAAEKFIHKVESGGARSTVTYAELREALSILKPDHYSKEQ